MLKGKSLPLIGAGDRTRLFGDNHAGNECVDIEVITASYLVFHNAYEYPILMQEQRLRIQ